MADVAFGIGGAGAVDGRYGLEIEYIVDEEVLIWEYSDVVAAADAAAALAVVAGKDQGAWAATLLGLVASVCAPRAGIENHMLSDSHVIRSVALSAARRWCEAEPRMRVICLVDNTARPSSQFWAEHGLAFLVESEAGSVLFDTGQSGTVLLHNMEEAGVAPKRIDAVAISHAHYDHTGGLAAFLEQARADLPLYANADLFRERFSRHGTVERIGPSLTESELRARAEVHLDTAPQEILPGVWTTGEIVERPEPEGRGAQHLVRGASGWVPDPYQDDMSLVVEVPSGLVLLCGCCHAGLLNTLYHVQRTFQRPIVAIAGGTHLVAADAPYLGHVATVLQGLSTLRLVAPNHCSGQPAFCTLWHELGPDIVYPCPAGTIFDLEAFL